MDPTTLLADLRRLDASINANEDNSIRDRWEYGRKILAFYLPEGCGRKQLRKGELDTLARELGVHRSEVGARMKFAKVYQSEEQLSTVIESCPSWSAIKQRALSDPSRIKPVSRSTCARLAALVKNIDADTLTADDLTHISYSVGRLNELEARLREVARAA